MKLFIILLLLVFSISECYIIPAFQRKLGLKLKLGAENSPNAIEAISPRQFVTVKELSRFLKLDSKDLLNDVTMKHKKRWYCKFDGVWHEYENQKDIILPLAFAISFAAKHKKILEPPVHLSELQYYPPSKIKSLKVPVVAVLGHFNHGKTSLIDFYCGSNIVDHEVHAITQVVRTRQASIEDESFSFVDTPGQEIFYRMRNSGAAIADVVLLVIAADSGVCQQTEECIGIAETLGRPMIVCINKIDKPEVTKDRIKQVEQELRQFIALENATIVPISAKSGEGIETLSDHLVSTLQHVRSTALMASSGSVSREQARHSKECSERLITGTGTVVNLVRSRQNGTMLHVLVQQGQVSVGNSFSSGGWCGGVREVVHDNQEKVESIAAGRGAYVKVALSSSSSEPRPLGHRVFFHSCKDRAKAREAAQELALRRQLERKYSASELSEKEAADLRLEKTAARVAPKKFALDTTYHSVLVDGDEEEQTEDTETDTEEQQQHQEEEEERLVLIKADSDLSLETILDAHFDAQEAWSQAMSDRGSKVMRTMKKLKAERSSGTTTPLSPMRIVSSGVGDVTLSDVSLASMSKALLLTYGVACDGRIIQAAARKGVSVVGFECLQDAISLVTGHYVKPTHREEDFSSLMVKPKRRSSVYD